MRELLLRSYYSTVEMVIPKPTSTTPIKVLRIKLLLSWFPVYYPVTKNVRVSWKNLEQRKGPRKAQILRKIPHLWLTSSSFRKKRGYFFRSPFLGVRSNRIEKSQFGKW